MSRFLCQPVIQVAGGYFTAKLVIFYPSRGGRKGKGLCAWFINELDSRACDY